MAAFASQFAHHLVAEECIAPEAKSSLLAMQPFQYGPATADGDRLRVHLARQTGQWAGLLSPEQTAYALAGVSASSVLLPLISMERGSDLLEYRVELHDMLDAVLVAELVAVLQQQGDQLNWQQTEAHVYTCVIAWGVAACFDTTPGAESLYLRCANTLHSSFSLARRQAELPRSLPLLQSTLYERFDALLAQARVRTWFWLAA